MTCLQFSPASPACSVVLDAQPGSAGQLATTPTAQPQGDFSTLLGMLFAAVDAGTGTSAAPAATPTQTLGQTDLKDNHKPAKEKNQDDPDALVMLQSAQIPAAQPKPPVCMLNDTSAAETNQQIGCSAVATSVADEPNLPVKPGAARPCPLVFAAQLTDRDIVQPADGGLKQKTETVQDAAVSKSNEKRKPSLIATVAKTAPAPPAQTALSKEKQSEKGGDEPLRNPVEMRAAARAQIIAAGVLEDKFAPPRTTPVVSSRPVAGAGIEPTSDVIAVSRPQPAKEISVRVPGADSAVDLKFTDSGGKVQVAVRSADPELARTIQSGVNDLVGHLEKRGFDTEAWVPSERTGPAHAEPASANAESGSSQQRHGGGNQDQQQGRQQWHGQRPKWLDQLGPGFSLDSPSGGNTQ